MDILYQNRVKNIFDAFTLDSMPRTILIEGEEGSGKHSFVSYVSNKLFLPVQDISCDLNFDKISEINLKTSPHVYVIDASMLTVKNENTILKFLEEPLRNAYIFILTNSRYNLIETIRNRCYIISLDKYDKHQLYTFIEEDNPDKDIIITVCTTPGQVKKYKNYNIREMLELADKIFDKIHLASYPNTLTLTNNIAFKNEKDKYDFSLFFKLLVYSAHNRFILNYAKADIVYDITNSFYNRAFVKNVDKKHLFENYLLQLKQSILRGD